MYTRTFYTVALPRIIEHYSGRKREFWNQSRESVQLAMMTVWLLQISPIDLEIFRRSFLSADSTNSYPLPTVPPSKTNSQ